MGKSTGPESGALGRGFSILEKECATSETSTTVSPSKPRKAKKAIIMLKNVDEYKVFISFNTVSICTVQVQGQVQIGH